MPILRAKMVASASSVLIWGGHIRSTENRNWGGIPASCLLFKPTLTFWVWEHFANTHASLMTLNENLNTQFCGSKAVSETCQILACERYFLGPSNSHFNRTGSMTERQVVKWRTIYWALPQAEVVIQFRTVHSHTTPPATEDPLCFHLETECGIGLGTYSQNSTWQGAIVPSLVPRSLLSRSVDALLDRSLSLGKCNLWQNC